jgi:hypothetical protein
MLRHLQFCAAGAGFVLPLLFVADDALTISLYFFGTAASCLAASRLPWPSDALARAGFALSALACLGQVAGVHVAVLVLVLSAASGATNVALLDAVAAGHPSLRQLLGLQSSLAVGNAVPLLLCGFGLSDEILVPAVGIACAGALAVPGVGTRQAAAGSTAGGLDLALCAGLATAVQLGLVTAAGILAEDQMARAVWVGTSFGIVIGRISGTLAVRWLTWRRAAELALASAVSTLLLSMADGVPVAGFWALLSAALVAPVFPLVLATSYGAVDVVRQRRTERRRPRGLRAGPVAVAVSIATSGVVPLLLTDAGRARAVTVLLVAAVLLAVILVRLPVPDARRTEGVHA